MAKTASPRSAQNSTPNTDELQARFMTPIGTDRPVNPDPSSEDAFNNVPEREGVQPSNAGEATPDESRSGGGSKRG